MARRTRARCSDSRVARASGKAGSDSQVSHMRRRVLASSRGATSSSARAVTASNGSYEFSRQVRSSWALRHLASRSAASDPENGSSRFARPLTSRSVPYRSKATIAKRILASHHVEHASLEQRARLRRIERRAEEEALGQRATHLADQARLLLRLPPLGDHHLSHIAGNLTDASEHLQCSDA